MIATWLKTTLALAAAVIAAWLALGMQSGAFWLVTIAAIAGELYLSRQLLREWNDEAGLRWWWTR